MPKVLASARVIAFLDMMRGVTHVPVTKEVSMPASYSGEARKHNVDFVPGQMDGLSLYEKQYVTFSALPNRLPEEVPIDAHRVLADTSPARSPIAVPVDLVQ